MSQPPVAQSPPVLLALDTGSTRVSVAVGTEDRSIAVRSVEISRSSQRLLFLVDEVLEEVGLRLLEIDGVVVLQGPGSFTGLRVGLATGLGFHQALGVRATGLSTLEVLAAVPNFLEAAPQSHGPQSQGPQSQEKVVAVVDALRGQWFVQPYASASHLQPLAAPGRWPEDRLGELAPATLVGFGVERLTLPETEGGSQELRLLEAPPLAPVAVRLAWRQNQVWDPGRLTQPLYLRPPAVTFPKVGTGPGVKSDRTPC